MSLRLGCILQYCRKIVNGKWNVTVQAHVRLPLKPSTIWPRIKYVSGEYLKLTMAGQIVAGGL